ncbi:MAG: TolC family protein [Candidatus Eremiobacterota bacterium]
MPRVVLLGLLCLLLSVPALCQETGPGGAPRLRGRLTLQEAVQYSLEHHLSVTVSQAELRAMQARTAEAEAAFRPKISVGTYLNAGDTHMIVSGAPGVEPGFWTTLPAGGLSLNLSLMLPLYTGGRLQARLAQAEANERAGLARTSLTLLETARSTRQAYHGLLEARSMEETARWELVQQEEVLRLARQELEVGRLAPYVIRRMEAETAGARQRLNSSSADAEVAAVALRTTLGVSVDSPVELDEPAHESLPEGGLEECVRLALAERPDLAVARFALEAADQRLAEVLSEYSPQLAFYTMAEGIRPQLTGPAPFEGGYQVGLVLSWPLYDGGERDARQDEANAMLEARSAEVRRMEYAVAAEVANARTRLAVARVNEELAAAEVVAATEELRIARLRFELGRGIYLEVLDALAAAARARNNLSQARHGRGLAEAEFLYSVGRY